MNNQQWSGDLSIQCHKGDYLVECEPLPRKRYSLFPKWYCSRCGRFVLPDKWHKPKFGMKVWKTIARICVR